jgi:hypothetical protein
MQEPNIKQDEFIRVCRLGKLLEKTAAKIPTFTDKQGMEGIELSKGVIIPFWIKKNPDNSVEKVYDQPTQDKSICAVIGAFEEKLKGVKHEVDQVKEKDTKTKDAEILPSSLINSIPDILEEKRIITPQDIEAWRKLSTFDRILLFQKTPKGLVRQRRGFLLPEFVGRDKKTLTDENFKMFQYLDANTMKQSANIAFLFEWSSVVESEHYFEAIGEVCVRGYIQVEINGKTYRRSCGGSGIKKGMMDWGDTMESAISEMTKRGIYHFLHGDVKRGEISEN